MGGGRSQRGAAVRAHLSQLEKAHSSDREKLQPTSFSVTRVEKSEVLFSASQPHRWSRHFSATADICWMLNWVVHCILTVVLHEVPKSVEEIGFTLKSVIGLNMKSAREADAGVEQTLYGSTFSRETFSRALSLWVWTLDTLLGTK